MYYDIFYLPYHIYQEYDVCGSEVWAGTGSHTTAPRSEKMRKILIMEISAIRPQSRENRHGQSLKNDSKRKWGEGATRWTSHGSS